MRKVDLLRELQELDSALDRAREGLGQRRPGLGDEGELVPLRQELEQAKRELRSQQEKGRDLEWELEKATGRLKVEEKKLYGGTIRNPKELSSLATEVEHERGRISRLEDQLLMNMDAVESASAVVERARRALGEREATWKAEQADLQAECDSLARQIEDLSLRRERTAARVEPGTLRVYEGIRRTRGGLAVVAIEQRACRGCRISLSSSEVQRARSSTELVTCQICGRILYVPG